jgi:AraC-like DNA-binding protein
MVFPLSAQTDSARSDSTVPTAETDTILHDSLLSDTNPDSAEEAFVDSVFDDSTVEIDQSDSNPVSHQIVEQRPGKAVQAEDMFGVMVSGIKKIRNVFSTIKQFIWRYIRTNPLFLFVRRYFIHLLILLISVVIIWYTVSYYLRKMDTQRFMTTTRLSIMDKEVQRACRYIEKNYSNQDLTLEMLCEELVTGKAFIEALFEKELGIRVDNFITQVRVNRIKLLLQKQPDLDQEQIAAETGFAGAERMADTFKKITKMSLAHYRQSLQQNREEAG